MSLYLRGILTAFYLKGCQYTPSLFIRYAIHNAAPQSGQALPLFAPDSNQKIPL